jgi:hypothetical protein
MFNAYIKHNLIINGHKYIKIHSQNTLFVHHSPYMKTGYDMERHKLLKILEKKEYGYWKWS